MRLPTRLERPKDTETAADALPDAAVIRQAQRLFGDTDYLLRVIAAESARLPTRYGPASS